jgi:hypothetical protein
MRPRISISSAPLLIPRVADLSGFGTSFLHCVSNEFAMATRKSRPGIAGEKSPLAPLKV